MTGEDGRGNLIENPTFSRRFFLLEIACWSESFKIPVCESADARHSFLIGEAVAEDNHPPAEFSAQTCGWLCWRSCGLVRTRWKPQQSTNWPISTGSSQFFRLQNRP